MIVIDDVIDKEYQEEIKNILFGLDFPWYVISDITQGRTEHYAQKRPAIGHKFIDNSKTCSSYSNLIRPLIIQGCKKAGFEVNEIIRAQTFLQFPLADSIINDKLMDTVHVDNLKPHWVFLYYVLDADGHTVIFDKTVTPEHGYYPKYHEDEYRIIEKVQPKQGRAIFFDGRHYHTAEQPRLGNRGVINVNVI